jgi:flagellar M-ring protein FliF
VAVATPQSGTRLAETTNYEVSKLTRRRVVPRGQIARLSVAVVVDDERTTSKGSDGQPRTVNKPRTPADLQRIQHLVASSVGLDSDRGDEVTIENIAFGDVAADDPLPPARWWQKLAPPSDASPVSILAPVVRGAVVLALCAMGFLLVLRPVVRHALQGSTVTATAVPQLAAGQMRTVADLESQIETEIDAARPAGSRRLPVLARRLSKTAEDQPERLARLVRTWLADEDH